MDPRDNSSRYIGRTFEGSARHLQHWISWRCRTESGKRRKEWLADLHASGRGPYLFTVLERLPNLAAATRAEVRWIAFGRANGWPLTNAYRSGGGGIPKEMYRVIQRLKAPGKK